MADTTSPFGFPYPEGTDLVRDGAQDIENLAEGVNDYLNGGYLYAGTRYYTSSGTFAKADPLGTGDIGLRAIRVRMVGGGGGSSGMEATGNDLGSVGSGGGGGGYAEKFVTNIAGLSASETVTVGSGGAGAVSDGNGSAGGTSSAFSVSASGGQGGKSDNWHNNSATGVTDTRLGGSGSGGDINIDGEPNGVGAIVSYLASGSFGGGGGGSQLGPSVRGTRSSASKAGKLYGGGAGGGFQRQNQSAAGGANGADGIIIVDCFV